jgi:hypothetical protein
VEWVKGFNMRVREFKELPGYNATIEKTILYFLNKQQLGQTSDFLRLLPLREYGGIYLDIDISIEKWDSNIHHYFDYFTYANIDGYDNLEGEPTFIHELHPGNDMMSARPNHPITTNYIQSIIQNVWAPYHLRPLQFQRCYEDLSKMVIFQTGPLKHSEMYYKYANTFEDNSYENYDYVEHLINELKSFYILSDEGMKVPIYVQGKPIHIGSWRTQKEDAIRIFGY